MIRKFTARPEKKNHDSPIRKRSAKLLSRLNLYLCLSVFICGFICLFGATQRVGAGLV